MSKMVQKFKEHLATPQGQRTIKEFGDRIRREHLRTEKVGKLVNEIGIEKMLKRIIDEHDERYRDKKHAEGVVPGPNHKCSLFFMWLQNNFEPIEVQSSDEYGPGGMFSAAVYFYQGYYFELNVGQGSFWRIYDSDKKPVFTI